MRGSAPGIELVLLDHDMERPRLLARATPHAAPSGPAEPLRRILRGLVVGLLTAAAVVLAPTAAGAAEPDPDVECTYDEGFWFWWLDLGQGKWECEPD